MLWWAGCGDKPEGTSPDTSTDKPGENKPSGPITITGRVWKSPGVPDTQARVLIPGRDRKPVVVDAQGAFTIPDITPPYDLAVRMQDSHGPLARVYKGLTRKDPEVFATIDPGAETRSSTLKGTVTGRQAAPETSTVRVSHLLPTIPGVWFSSRLGGGSVTDASGAFSFESDWSKNSSDVGSLVALEYTPEIATPG